MNDLTVAGAILALPVGFVVPGWLWLRRFGAGPLVSLYCGLAATAAAAGCLVGLALLLPLGVRTTCVAGAALLAVLTAWCAATAPRPLLPDRADLAGLAVFACAFAGAAAFVAVPSRPPALWDTSTVGPGRVDSPRWAGLAIDNTLPYRVGQVALHKQGDQLRDKFAVGWWISDRTPLLGLEFAFSAAVLDAHVRADNPSLAVAARAPMEVKDPYGYWLYNNVAALFAAAIVLGVFLLAREWKQDPRVATVASLLAALSGGLFLNTIYTWPKTAIGYFVLTAAALALRRRPAGAGAMVALAYLCHPGGAFWAPSVFLLLLSDPELRRGWRQALPRAAAPAVALILPWQLFTSLHMHAFSRWLFWPLGADVYIRDDFTKALSAAWHTFVTRGLAGDVWVRVESTAASLLPTSLTGPGSQNGLPRLSDAQIYWSGAHGVSVWGMVGLVLFPAVVVALSTGWERYRWFAVRFAGPYLALAIVLAGFPDNWSSQSSYPLVGALLIVAAELLLAAGRGVRRWLWLAVALEFVTTAYVCEYDPYNASTATILAFAVLGMGAHLLLMAWLAGDLGLGPPGGRRRRGRRRVHAMRAGQGPLGRRPADSGGRPRSRSGSALPGGGC